jgi:hypothetical protein
MADLLSTLATRSGLTPDLTQRGMEALLGSLRNHLPDEAFAKLTSSLPDVQQLLSSPERIPARLEDFAGPTLNDAGRNAGTATPLPLTELLSQLTRAGFSLDAVQKFLPVAIGLLRANLPPELMRHVERSIPGLGNISRPTGPAGLIDRLRNLF